MTILLFLASYVIAFIWEIQVKYIHLLSRPNHDLPVHSSKKRSLLRSEDSFYHQKYSMRDITKVSFSQDFFSWENKYTCYATQEQRDQYRFMLFFLSVITYIYAQSNGSKLFSRSEIKCSSSHGHKIYKVNLFWKVFYSPRE